MINRDCRCPGCGACAASEQIRHVRAALRHIARVSADPDIAQFALRAAEDPPSAFAPEEDYEVPGKS